MNDQNIWNEVLEGMDYVLHLATPTDEYHISEKDMIDTAVKGTKAIINAALHNGVKKLVITSR